MTEQKRKGVWAEVHTIREEHTGLAVVIKERIRGRPAYSWQIVHVESDGKRNQYLPYPVRGLDKVPVDGDVPPKAEDVIKALTAAAEAWIKARMAAAKPQSDKPRDKGKPRGKRDDKKREAKGGLSSLAKADAEAAGHVHKTKSQKRRERRDKARSEAKAEST